MKLLLTAVLGVAVVSSATLLSVLKSDQDSVADGDGTLTQQRPGHASGRYAATMSAHAAGFNLLPASFRGAWAVKHPADDAASW